MGYIVMRVTVLLILKDFLSRFEFGHQDGVVFGICKESFEVL